MTRLQVKYIALLEAKIAMLEMEIKIKREV
jgi:hypothetical protein